MNKISIVGAGRVGETTAQTLAQQGMCNEVVLLDVREGAAAGAALDIRQTAPFFGFDVRVTGGSDPALLRDSDMVIITAGSPRKPGMSRSDVLDINKAVIESMYKSFSWWWLGAKEAWGFLACQVKGGSFVCQNHEFCYKAAGRSVYRSKSDSDFSGFLNRKVNIRHGQENSSIVQSFRPEFLAHSIDQLELLGRFQGPVNFFVR